MAFLLARTAPVLFLEPRIRWHPAAIGFSLKRLRRLLDANPRPVAPNIWAFTPKTFPCGSSSPVYTLNNVLLTRQIRKTVRQLHFREPILWFCETSNAPTVRAALPQAPCVYHAIDYQRLERDAKAAQDLASTSDVVIASTELILNSLGVTGRPTYVLRNAWAPWPDTAPTAVPPELKNLPKPYAGLVGSLGPTLDFALLNILAENLRASIIVIGEPTGGLSSADRTLLQLLRRKTNVYFLGKRPTAVLAQYIAACDVCLAPYKQNERVYASSPLKYWQYLALGKPVVTTPVAELEDLEPLVRVARDCPSFVDAVRRILDCPEDAQVARRRRQYAASNTWEVRWQSLREFLKSVPTLSVLAD